MQDAGDKKNGTDDLIVVPTTAARSRSFLHLRCPADSCVSRPRLEHGMQQAVGSTEWVRFVGAPDV
jgi:hypothetical protein